MYDAMCSGNIYRPKKVCTKTVKDVFRLSASTKRRSCCSLCRLEPTGCLPLPSRALLARPAKVLVECPGLGEFAGV